MQKLRTDSGTRVLLNRLLEQALEQPADGIEPWLAGLSTEFDGLKPRLRAMLARAAKIETNDFLHTLPKFELIADEPSRTPPRVEQAGAEIGPYRLIRELGAGGMGVVWLAERTDGLITRPVALKLPHGAWKRAGLAERMARERAILGTLTHPNIAHLYDAGLAADGQPYLAIEYIEGHRIDRFCDEQQLGVSARLKLFVQVATAVAYAHGKLVVHRDLKPANILVSAEGRVRLLDFGIAKLLEEGGTRATPVTEMPNRALTPDYAAPEQIRGEPLTVASDVYSLGVVLYELLSGQRPYKLQRDSRGALEDAILQADPVRPSEVAPAERRKALRGDLDTVVLKALRKKPEQRYPTVHALLDDIERYLSERPVLAQPDSRWYRLRKFIARNKLAVSAGGAIFMALLVGAGLATWQARVALAQSQRAEEVKNFIVGIFADADPLQTGMSTVPSAVELLDMATTKLDQLADVPLDVRIELRNVLGKSMLSLEAPKAAEAVLQRAVQESTGTFGATHPTTVHARRLLSRALQTQDKREPARAELLAIMPLLRAGSARDPGELIAGLFDLGRMQARDRQFEASIATTSEALALVRTRLGNRSPLKIDLLVLHTSVYRQLGQLEKAKSAAFEAYATAQELHRDQPGHPKLVETRFYYGVSLAKLGQFIEACAEYRSVYRDTEALFGAQGRTLGMRLSSTAADFSEAGFLAESLQNSVRARAILLATSGGNTRIDAATAENVGLVALASRDTARAIDALTTAVDAFRREYGATHETVMDVQRNRSLALSYAGRLAEAEQAMAEVLAHHPRNARDRFEVVSWITGIRKRLAGEFAVALQLQQQALASLAADHTGSLDAARIRTELALNQIELGQHEAARAVLAPALATFEARQAAITPGRADALMALGRIELAAGAHDAARVHLAQAEAFWRGHAPDSRWAGEAALWLGRCQLARQRE